jgi:hypothetical protein
VVATGVVATGVVVSADLPQPLISNPLAKMTAISMNNNFFIAGLFLLANS